MERHRRADFADQERRHAAVANLRPRAGSRFRAGIHRQQQPALYLRPRQPAAAESQRRFTGRWFREVPLDLTLIKCSMTTTSRTTMTARLRDTKGNSKV